MTSKTLFISQAVLVSMLGACAATPPFSGESAAGDTLKSDTARQVSLAARVYAECKDIESIHAQVLKGNPAGTGKTLASMEYGSVEERWIVKLCGKDMPFLVTFTPDGKGGTFFSTTLDK